MNRASPSKILLHVGCGPKRKDQTTPGFASPQWQELRFDIDPEVAPDIVGTLTDLSLATSSVDAIFSSHNLEHLYPHQVPLALAEFRRVLKPDGFAVITCPDLQSVCALVAKNQLTEPAYVAAEGPIAPLDILYGYRPAIAQGKLSMAHHCGFTRQLLRQALQDAGFATVTASRRGPPHYDLWALATVRPSPRRITALTREHWPVSATPRKARRRGTPSRG